MKNTNNTEATMKFKLPANTCVMTYEIYNIQTGEVKGHRKVRTAARRLANKLDFEYGAICFDIRLAQAVR